MLPLAGGDCTVEVEGRRFELTGRESVFARVTDWVYVPIDAELRLSSAAGCELALASARATRRFDPAYVEAGGVPVELRGAGQSTRQLNNFMVPEVFDGADRLICCEVLTPDGNWSSYPPHKHDARPSEVDNEEIYYFRVGRTGTTAYSPDGFAVHRTYTDDRSIDETVDRARRRRFLVPAGYHGPCIAAPGYPLYYLNVMASDAGPRKLAFVDDEPHHWIRATWEGMALDARLPDDLGNRRRGGMTMHTVRLTTAQAIVRYPHRPAHARRRRGAAAARGRVRHLRPRQRDLPGRGALRGARRACRPTAARASRGWRWPAIGFAKAMRRRQFMAATSSVGPGAMNMVTAAAVAHANRLPLLLLAGDTFHSRIPDPVLQQVEHFDEPSVTVNDAFRPVTRYWDRITSPAQVAQSLPLAIATLLDPADCGPAFLGLPQDVQAEAYDYPVRLFEPVVHELRRQRPDHRELAAAAAALRGAKAPLIVAGGGVHYALAEQARCATSPRRTACRSSRRWRASRACVADHPLYAGPIGVTGCPQANALAAQADVVLAVGTRLQDFTTGSWTVFGNEDLRIIGLNAARFDAAKHRSLPLVCDALEGLDGARLGARRLVGAARSGARRRRPRRRPSTSTCARPSRRGRSDGALLRAGDRGRQLRGRPRRLRRLGRGRLPRRAQRQLARARRRDVRLRVRLLVHGLRARRRLGREHGAGAAAR